MLLLLDRLLDLILPVSGEHAGIVEVEASSLQIDRAVAMVATRPAERLLLRRLVLLLDLMVMLLLRHGLLLLA